MKAGRRREVKHLPTRLIYTDFAGQISGAEDDIIQNCRRHFVSHKSDLNACHQARFLGARYGKIAFAAGAPPRPPLGSL